MNDFSKGCEVLLTICSESKKHENIVLITDKTSCDVAFEMWNAAQDYNNKSLIIMDEKTMHGQEPPYTISLAMLNADVIFGITKFSLFHTDARRNAVANGARFINMVDFNLNMLLQGGLHIDFIEQGKVLDIVAGKMVGNNITITSPMGTNVTASIKDRPTVPQYGRSIKKGQSSSPPNIECAIAPLEYTANGIVYIDGSIPHPEIGLITEPILLELRNGAIIRISGGEQAQILSRVLEEFDDNNVYQLGEIGIGLNPKCKLSGRMLEDEGAMGTVHFGFGSNTSFSGNIISNNHLDMVFKYPTVVFDDGMLLLKDGVIIE